MRKKQGLGVFTFSMFMVITALFVGIPMIEFAKNSVMQICGAFTCFGLGFCGCAATFKESMTKQVHFIGAYTAAVCGITWCILYDWHHMVIAMSLMSLGVLTAGMISNMYDKAHEIFWLEITGFGSIALFSSVFI